MKKSLATLALLTATSLAVSDEVVTTNQDGNNVVGSLREAIENAAPGERVVFDPAQFSGPINVGLVGGQFLIDKDLIIDGSDIAGGVTISGQNTTRVFEITSGVTVTFISLHIEDGQAPHGADAPSGGRGGLGGNGGGILNAGDLTLRSCTVSNNSSGDGGNATEDLGGSGGFGGGIYSEGNLTLLNTTVSGNSTGDGGNSGTLPGMPPTLRNGANGGLGGGICFVGSGNLIMDQCTVSDNQTGDGGNGTREGGDGGDGGGLWTNNTTCDIDRCTFSDNTTGIGGVSGNDELNPFDGGTGGNGGGIALVGTTCHLDNCTVSGNSTGAGGISGTASASPGQGGSGGGIYCDDAAAELRYCTVAQNQTGRQQSQLNAVGGDGGGVWQSGNTSSTVVENSVFTYNFVATNGQGPDYGLAPDGSTLTPQGVNCVSINDTVDGANHFPVPNPNNDLVGTSGFPFEPFLQPLADNGGPTQTHSPYFDSPIVDPVGSAATAPHPTDQRGRSRRSGFRTDLGAVEYQFPNPGLVTRSRVRTARSRVILLVRVNTPVRTTLRASATGGAKAVARGNGTRRRVIVSRLKRRVTVVRLLARDIHGKSTRKTVRVLKK